MISGISSPTSTPMATTTRYSASLNGADDQAKMKNSAAAEKPPRTPTSNST
ncbi:MAG: hypothetical protein AW09_003779 [Candidatus Accumulibacter phosphatis]|uniref:Uncharacterized protein n=1 Tax=Candidatus Accumulibacter phosphatis TaxID=327160 RepID=A0A080LS30_9PROT|nr:MAG: hypothetical protein AW09_003779 [Candidatus Accumulibacter phosphatis]